MEDKKIKKCSLCDVVGHNIRTCPLKPIDDTFIRDDYIHEEVVINPQKELFIQDLLDRVKDDITAPINEYSLQIGAYGKKSNAKHQMQILLEDGYDARIESVNSNGIILYTVRVGYFANYADAKRQQEKIYSRLAVNSIIIKSE